jgi:hypothetical protein
MYEREVVSEDNERTLVSVSKKVNEKESDTRYIWCQKNEKGNWYTSFEPSPFTAAALAYLDW